MQTHSTATRRRRPDSSRPGFALLLVFAMAAALALLIYMELPRAAFEHQRDKEQLLVDRGEQYARAVELYARKFRRNPQTLEDLEHAQNIRFLRRRYKDPMTGSDEWRMIHVDAAGQYTDSKVHKKAGAAGEKDTNTPSILASNVQGLGASATLIQQPDQGAGAGLLRRPSDRIGPGGMPGQTNQAAPTDVSGGVIPPDPSQLQQNIAGSAKGMPLPPGILPPGVAGGDQSGANPPPAPFENNPGGPNSISAQQALASVQQILGANRQTAAATPSNSSNFNNTGAAGNAALAPNGMGAGLVGVATKKEMEGIRLYKEHSNYSEWEFVYDAREAAQEQQKNSQQGAQGNAAGPGSSNFGGMPGGGNPAPGRQND